MSVMKKNRRSVTSPSPKEVARRKRFLGATVITCIALVMIGGSLHVVKIGAGRMDEMRGKATYDLKEEKSRERAAGEDLFLHAQNEVEKAAAGAYTMAEANALLSSDQWHDVDTIVLVPAGIFVMGTNLPDTDPQNRPQHKVNLPAYRIDKYLVTNAQYARFVAATGHRSPLNWKDGRIPDGQALFPVTMVNWYDAAAYAKWAGKRLPSEAEWEKAARGTDGRRWPWGNIMDPNRLNTYYNVGAATRVNAYSNGQSPYGAFDMAGNVSEWIADDFLPYPGSDASPDLFKGKVAKTTGAEDQAMKLSDLVEVNQRYKVLRGGSWKSDPFTTASYHRNFAFPNYASDFFGFRCVEDVKGAKKPALEKSKQ